MPEGYQVDLVVLGRAAEAGTSIAGDARPLVKELSAALDDLAAGAADSQSASVAGSVAGRWTSTLGDHADRIQGVSDKLKETAADYLSEDGAAASTFSKIKPAGNTEPVPVSRVSALLDGLPT